MRSFSVEKIKRTRVFFGGLVAGAVVFAFILFPVLAVYGPPFAMAGSETTTLGALLLVMTFLVSVQVTWLYAEIRSRYGAGIKTAALAGIVMGLLFCLFQFIAWILASRPIPAMVVASGAALTFASLLVAAVLGAWIYDKPTN